jgi:hypothetical protein
MAYNAILNERIREAMLKHQNVEQKEMFGHEAEAAPGNATRLRFMTLIVN